MKLLLMSDIHCRWEAFKPETEAEPGSIDGIIIAGDITNYGDSIPVSEWYKAYGWFESLRQFLRATPEEKPIYWIGGNHDFGAQQFASHVSHLATFIQDSIHATPWISSSGAAHTIQGMNLSPCYDLPFLARRWSNMTCSLEEEANYYGNKLHSSIVVSHCPAHKVCDNAHGKSLGSSFLGSYLQKHKPQLFVCGHIHEDNGYKPGMVEPFGGTHYYNVAQRIITVTL